MFLNSSNQKRLKNNTIRASIQKLSRSVILYACAKLYENVVEKNIAGLLIMEYANFKQISYRYTSKDIISVLMSNIAQKRYYSNCYKMYYNL